MEERNIKISLEKAKEWYKQGGDLRKIALQAFSESELIRSNKFPSSWSEYNYNAICKYVRINAGCIRDSAEYDHFSTKEEAEAFVALGKLIQLRDKYWRLDNNWKPEYCNNHLLYYHYVIIVEEGMVRKGTSCFTNHILAFRTAELRDKFYENFEDLIKQAKMFL